MAALGMRYSEFDNDFIEWYRYYLPNCAFRSISVVGRIFGRHSSWVVPGKRWQVVTPI
jgi:hypothetical protein